TFIAIATDTDQPPQTLTFSLGAGAPTGASIDPTSGRFAWRPITAPSTNIVRLVVTDNGKPSLSATQTVIVTVVLPPQLSGASVNGNQFTVTWQTASSQSYQVEYEDDLNATTWIPLGNPLTGTGGSLTVTNNVTVGQRFYRLRILP